MIEHIQNFPVSKTIYLGNGIFERFIRTSDERIEQVVIVEDDTTIEDIRKAWVEIASDRERLRKAQGTNLQDVRNTLIWNYSQMKKKGWSYAEIARSINLDYHSHLHRAAVQMGKNKEPTGLYFAELQLKAMRVKDEDVSKLLESGLEEIQAGRRPWTEKENPIDRYRVRNALRQFDREKKSGKIVIKENSEN